MAMSDDTEPTPRCQHGAVGTRGRSTDGHVPASAGNLARTSTLPYLNANFEFLQTSQLKEKYNLIEFGIFPSDRSKLHERIESRQGALVGDRLLEEITQIQNAFKISAEHPAMKAINYRQGLQVLEGKLEKSELFEKSLYATRQFAKRQCTWMRGWENLNYFDLHQGEVKIKII